MAVTVELSSASNTTAYTEGVAVVLFPTATITGTDSPGANNDINGIDRITIDLGTPSSTMSLFLSATAASLAATNGISVTYDAINGTLTLQGDNENTTTWQDILRGVTYNDTSDAPASPGTITVTATNTSSSGGTDTDTHGITITQVNDAPTLDLSGDTVRDEFGVAGSYGSNNGSVNWSGSWVESGDNNSAASGEISVSGGRLVFNSDIDGGETVSRAANLSGASSARLTFDYDEALDSGEDILVEAWNGSAWELLGTITGSSSDGARTFTAELSTTQIGAHTNIRIRTDDNWSTGDSFAVDNVTIAYTTAAATGNSTTFTENGSAVAISANAVITDADDSNMESASVTLTNKQVGDQFKINGAVVGQGSTGNVGGVAYTVADNGSSITITFSGSHSKALYEAAIKAVTFENTSDNPSTTPRTVNVTVNDGSANSNMATTTITVTPTNDAPTTDLNGATAGTNGSAAFTEQTSVLISPAGTVADPDSNISSMTVTLTNRLNGDAIESLSLNAAAEIARTTAGLSLSYTPETGVLLISGSASPAVYQAILQGILYNNTSDAPNTTARTVSVVVNDGSLNSTSNTVTISVTPVNDAPVGADKTIAINEDGSHAFISSDFGFSDVDLHSFVSVNITGVSGQGTLTLGGVEVTPPASIPVGQIGNLVWTPDPNANGNGLGSITFEVVDSGSSNNTSAPKTITFDVASVNDAATVTAGGTASYTENGAPIAIQTNIAVADIDNGTMTGAVVTITNFVAGDVLHFTDQNGITGSYVDGVLTLSGNASVADYQAALNSILYSSTSENPTGTPRSITYAVDDGSGLGPNGTATVNVTPENDAAIIGGTIIGAVTESDGASAGVPTATGDLSSTDVDGSADAFQAVTTPTASVNGYGTFTVTASGVWTFTLDNNNSTVQELKGGSIQDTFTVLAADGTSQVITITINGADDVTVIGGTASGSVIEAGGAANGTPGDATASGVLDAVDADDGDVAFTAGSQTSAYGTLTIDADGNWTYQLDDDAAAVQALNDTQTHIDNFVVTAGGVDKTIAITINGKNDAAVITGEAHAEVTENGVVAGTAVDGGDLHADDVDNIDDAFVPGSQTGLYGTLQFGADGQWTYTLDNGNANVDALNTGSTPLTETFTVETIDGTQKTITVAINGANDAAVISGTDTGSVTETGVVSGTPTAMGNLDSTDVDNAADTFVAETVGGSYGSVTIGADGAWTYTLNNANGDVQALNVGGSLTDTITVKAIDGTQHNIVITINGANDAATVTGDVSKTITESGIVPQPDLMTGDLNATDPDNANDTFVPKAELGTYGTFSIGSDGKWTYTLDNNNATVNALSGTQSLQEMFTVQTADGTSQVVTVNIAGADDAVGAVSDTDTDLNTVIENASAGTEVGVTAHATDPDNGAVVTYSLDLASDALFDIDATTGVVTVGNGAIIDFEAGATRTITVTATSGTSISSQNFVINIGNVDDTAPIFSSASTADAIDENSGAGQAIYTAVATDAPDGGGSAVTYSLAAGDDLFDIDATTGVVTLVGQPDAEHAGGYSFTVRATDLAGNSSTHVVTLPVNNLDEVAPTITSGAIGTATENAGAGQIVYNADADDTADISGGVMFSLVPGGDASLFTIDATTGEVTLNEDPNFETKSTYTFTVLATDAAGLMAQQAVTVNVTNRDEDKPEFTSGSTATPVTEGSGANQIVYDAEASDPATDGGPSNPIVYSLSDNDGGAFTIDPATGQVRLVGNPDFEVKSSYAFTVVATDAAGNFESKTVTLAINQNNEGPTITTVGGQPGGASAVALSITENTTVVGTVVAADPDVGDTVTFSIEGGDDALKFQIDAVTGALSLIASADFEAPTDANGDGIYDVIVKATDSGGLTDLQSVSVTVTDDDDAPVITSNGGGPLTGATANVNVKENTKSVTTVTSSDQDAGATKTYSLAGGADMSKFTINATTGVLTLKTAADFEVPTDAGKNKVFDVIVKVTDDGGLFDTQALAVKITDVKGANYRGTAAANTQNGTVEADTFTGLAGNDRFSGLAGDDRFLGGAGNDRLTGGLGKDTFVFNTVLSTTTNRDTIVDFNRIDDTFQLENAIFKKLAKVGTLSAANFKVGTKALDANDYIVYDKAKGILSYDADGSGAGAAVQFALLSNKVVLTAADFVVI